MSEPTKTCTKCGNDKPLSEFYAHPGRSDGHRSHCKSCIKGAQRLRPGANRTPKQRAEYRRRRGEVAAPYVPLAERKRRAAERRAKQLARAARAEQYTLHVKEYRRHIDTIRAAERWRARYKTDPEFALAQRLRTQARKRAKLFPKLDDLIRGAIDRGGESRTVADVCGYTIAELKAHIERQFTDGMNWQAFLSGAIHIDHIKPQRLFDLSKLDEVRACWALSNLRPLWRRDNLAKGGRWEGEKVAA